MPRDDWMDWRGRKPRFLVRVAPSRLCVSVPEAGPQPNYVLDEAFAWRGRTALPIQEGQGLSGTTGRGSKTASC